MSSPNAPKPFSCKWFNPTPEGCNVLDMGMEQAGTVETYYDRSLRLWVQVTRASDGTLIPNEITGETATYSPTDPRK